MSAHKVFASDIPHQKNSALLSEKKLAAQLCKLAPRPGKRPVADITLALAGQTVVNGDDSKKLLITKTSVMPLGYCLPQEYRRRRTSNGLSNKTCMEI